MSYHRRLNNRARCRTTTIYFGRTRRRNNGVCRTYYDITLYSFIVRTTHVVHVVIIIYDAFHNGSRKKLIVNERGDGGRIGIYRKAVAEFLLSRAGVSRHASAHAHASSSIVAVACGGCARHYFITLQRDVLRFIFTTLSIRRPSNEPAS